MPEIVVSAERRTETGKNANRRLRARGLVPGVVYGAGQKPTEVAVAPREIGVVLRSASGENTIFDLDVAGTRRKVILKEHQREPVRGAMLHVDFYEVALDKPIEVKVHVELFGTPVGVKVDGGVLDFITRELVVSCLPLDIPEKILVDVSELHIGKHLRVEDLKLSDKIRIQTEPGVVIAHVVTMREEEVAAVAPEAEVAATTEPEVIKKGKGEGEVEGAEKDKEKDKDKDKKEKKDKK